VVASDDILEDSDLNSTAHNRAHGFVRQLYNLLGGAIAVLWKAQAEGLCLGDEINRFKGEQGTPPIKSNTPQWLFKDYSAEQKRCKAKACLKDGRTHCIPVDPAYRVEVVSGYVPLDAACKGFADVLVQDLPSPPIVLSHKTKFYSLAASDLLGISAAGLLRTALPQGQEPGARGPGVARGRVAPCASRLVPPVRSAPNPAGQRERAMRRCRVQQADPYHTMSWLLEKVGFDHPIGHLWPLCMTVGHLPMSLCAPCTIVARFQHFSHDFHRQREAPWFIVHLRSSLGARRHDRGQKVHGLTLFIAERQDRVQRHVPGAAGRKLLACAPAPLKAEGRHRES